MTGDNGSSVADPLAGHRPSAGDDGFADVCPLPSDPPTIQCALSRVLLWDAFRSCIDPWDYPFSDLGLNGFLQAHGINTHHVSGYELCRARDVDLVRKTYGSILPQRPDGEPLLLCGRQHWHGYAVLALICQRLRGLTGQPIVFRYCWRPRLINDAVGGSKGSDHLEPACAVDVRFSSGRAYERAAQDLLKLWEANTLMLSIGANPRTYRVHIGVAARRTLAMGEQRRWAYDSSGMPVTYTDGAWGVR